MILLRLLLLLGLLDDGVVLVRVELEQLSLNHLQLEVEVSFLRILIVLEFFGEARSVTILGHALMLLLKVAHPLLNHHLVLVPLS